MKYITIIALLAVAAGCDIHERNTQGVRIGTPDEIVTYQGHEYLQEGHGLVHSESCPAHSLLVEITERRAHILSAAPSGTILIPFPGEDVRLETDTRSRLDRPVDYWCIQARMPDDNPAYLRLELDTTGLPTRVLHIHTCSTNADTCHFLFDHRGYYNGCNCGGDLTVVGLP